MGPANDVGIMFLCAAYRSTCWHTCWQLHTQYVVPAITVIRTRHSGAPCVSVKWLLQVTMHMSACIPAYRQARLPVALVKRLIAFLAYATFYIGGLGLAFSTALARSAALSVLCLAMALALEVNYRRTFWAHKARTSRARARARGWASRDHSSPEPTGSSGGEGAAAGSTTEFDKDA